MAQKSYELSFQSSTCSLHLTAYKVLCIQGKKSTPVRRSDSNLGSSASQIGETAKAPPAQMSDLRDKKSRARIQVPFNSKLWNFVQLVHSNATLTLGMNAAKRAHFYLVADTGTAEKWQLDLMMLCVN